MVTVDRRTRLLSFAVALASPSAWAAWPARRETTQTQNREPISGLLQLNTPLLDWDRVVVHHTTAEYATLAGLNRYYETRFDAPLGCQYRLLGLNGKKRTRLGALQRARWPHPDRGVHILKPKKTPNAITISLTDNFREPRVPRQMMSARADLTSALIRRFGITVNNVTTHRGVDGRITQCSGKHFSISRRHKELFRREKS